MSEPADRSLGRRATRRLLDTATRLVQRARLLDPARPVLDGRYRLRTYTDLLA